jgi:hypothetical protein
MPALMPETPPHQAAVRSRERSRSRSLTPTDLVHSAPGRAGRRNLDDSNPDSAGAPRWPEADHDTRGVSRAAAEAAPRRGADQGARARASLAARRIERGQAKSITDLAEQEGVTDAYVCRLLPLTCLAPDIVEAILDGRQPKGAEAGRDAGERTPCMGGAAKRLGVRSDLCVVRLAQEVAELHLAPAGFSENGRGATCRQI